MAQGLPGGTRANFSIGGWPVSVGLDEALASGKSRVVPCRRGHVGYDGDLLLTCNGGVLVADSAMCLRARCPRPDVFLRRREGAARLSPPAEGIPVPGLEGGDVDFAWVPLAPLADGRLLAGPNSASRVLEIDVAGTVQTFGDAGDGPLKYFGFASLPGGQVFFGFPYFASRVLFIDAANHNVTFVGPDFGVGGSKWYGAAGAGEKWWGIPYNHAQVLRIAEGESGTLNFDLLGDLDASDSKWWEAIVVENLVLAIPCSATSLLLIDAAADSVETFGGAFPATFGKWRGAAATRDGVVYAMPHGHGQVLKVHPLQKTVSFIGKNYGAGESKWHGAVVASDGRIFAIPSSATTVLVVDPATDSVMSLGALAAGASKWAGGALSSSGLVFGVPALASSTLVVDPSNNAVSLSDLGGSHLGAPQDRGGSKWSSAVLGRNGAVYATPNAATSVLRLDSPSACTMPPPQKIEIVCEMGEPCFVTLSSTHVSVSSNGLSVVRAGNCVDSSAVLANFEGWANPQTAEAVPTPAPTKVPISSPTSAPSSTPTSAPTIIPTFLPTREPTSAAPTTRPTTRLTLLPTRAPTNEVGALQVSFSLGWALRGSPLLSGAYRLCWGDNPAAAPVGEEYDQDVGWLIVNGPHSSGDTACTLGLACFVELLAGRGLLLTDYVAVLESENWTLVELPGFVNPGTTVGSMRKFFLGLPFGPEPGVHELRWGRVADLSVWRVEVGTLSLHGPRSVGTSTCSFGEACSISLDGLGLLKTDALALRYPRSGGCSQDVQVTTREPGYEHAGWCGGLCQASRVGEMGISEVFMLGAQFGGDAPSLSAETWRPREFALCWASGGNAAMAGKLFEVEVGAIVVEGPVKAVREACKLGVACAVKLEGYGLALTNILFVAAAGALCQGLGSNARLAKIGLPANPVSVFSLNTSDAKANLVAVAFSLGAAQGGASSTYRLCWEAADGGSSAAVDVGALDLLPNNCYVELPTGAVVFPCVEGSIIAHGGSCRPKCQSGFDPNASEALQCAVGRLWPPSFTCHKRCGAPPTVQKASVQKQCVDLHHGDTCEVTCPTGYVKSGNFFCYEGVFSHVPNPALPGALSLPAQRCLQPCAVGTVVATDADGAACASGSINVAHGALCEANCPEGTLAFDMDGVYEQPSFLCRDGTFDQLGYRCIKNCGQPVLAHAVDLQICRGLPHGRVCPLWCTPPYTKTGDLHCTNGQFDEQRCIPPCDLQAIWPEGIPNAKEQPCIGQNDYVMHKRTCYPDCETNYSNIVADEALTCLNGSFRLADGSAVNVPFTCHRDCVDAPPGEEFVPNARDFSERCSGMKHGQSCPIICVDSAVGVGNLRCMDGTYRIEGMCTLRCSYDPEVVGSAGTATCPGTEHGAECEIECQSTYTKVGNLQCSNGQWLDIDLCKKDCVASTCVEGTGIHHGASCSRFCPEGLGTDDVAFCTDGELLPNAFECLPMEAFNCDEPIFEGILVDEAKPCGGTPHGATCNVGCQEGYKRIGALVCVLGKWNHTACEDQRRRCIGLPSIKNGNVAESCFDNLVGTLCDLICAAGFEPGLRAKAECLEGSKWGGGDRCVPKACKIPPVPPHAEMQCNGKPAADECVVTCQEGYGYGGALRCDTNASWQSGPSSQATTAAHSTVAAESLCSPLPCARMAHVPNMLSQSCEGTPHGTSCYAFVCQQGFQEFGAYVCEYGKLVALAMCLPGAAGVADSLGAVAPLLVRMSAAWGDLTIGFGTSASRWGGVAAPYVLAALQASLIGQIPPMAAEVKLLGWSLSQFGTATDGLRRLALGVEVTYYVAALPLTREGVSDSDAAEILAANLPSRLSASLLEAVAANASLELPLGYGGLVALAFAGLASAPVVRPYGVAALPPPPSAAPTPPRPFGYSIDFTELPTIAPTPAPPPNTSAMQEAIARYWMVVVFCVSIVVSCLLGVCIAHYWHKRKKRMKRNDMHLRRASTTILANAPPPNIDLSLAHLGELARLDWEQKKNRTATSADLTRARLGRAMELQVEVDGGYSYGKDRGKEKRTQADANELNKRISCMAEEVAQEEFNRIMRVDKAMPVSNLLNQCIMAHGRPMDFNYYLRSQADFELPEELLADYIGAGASDALAGALAVDDIRDEILEDDIDAESMRNPGEEEGDAEIRQDSARMSGVPKKTAIHDSRKSTINFERRLLILGAEDVSMRKQNQSPGGRETRNGNLLQNSHKSSCKQTRGPTAPTYFHVRPERLMAASVEYEKQDAAISLKGKHRKGTSSQPSEGGSAWAGGGILRRSGAAASLDNKLEGSLA